MRAGKPAISDRRKKLEIKPETASDLSTPAENVNPENKMDYLLKRAFDLGAEKAKAIDTDTVVIEEWVRWKCKYGCGLYDKDAFRPSFAPYAESAKKVLKERLATA